VPPDQVVTGFDDPAPYAAGHRGVDLAASVGQTVVSAGAGQITTAGPVAGRGVVVVDHGAVRTSYLPVVALVRVGDVVAAGQPLGQVAAQAHCPAVTCLHWGARVGDRYVDPRSLLASSGPVVLLPLDP
jgi:murein DD-endopeptidase MepM/ murein hydrolase activator NlpD